MKYLTTILMYIAIALISLAMILKLWYLLLPVLIIQVIIAFKQKGRLNVFATGGIYLGVEIVFSLIIWAVVSFIRLI